MIFSTLFFARNNHAKWKHSYCEYLGTNLVLMTNQLIHE